jgi:hypothetical protein
MDSIRSLHNRIIKNRLMFAYRGEVSERNSLALLTLLENEMKDESFGFTGRKRLFMYVLESLQNIAKHGDHTHHYGMSTVTYSRTDDGYTVTTGNVLDSEHVTDLRGRLEKVNSLDPGEIKEIYRQILNNAEFSKKGGAGLGLLEMAIKTGNRLDFDFLPVDADHSYFLLSKTVDSTGTGVNLPGKAVRFDCSLALDLEKLMTDRNIHMIWSGHISSEIGEEVLTLTESKLDEEDVDTSLRKRVFSIMAETLENVSKYNPGKETEAKLGMPVVILRLEGSRFLLTTGNLINTGKVKELKGKLDMVNSLDQTGLRDTFYRSLSKQTIETDSTENMGLLAIARKSGSKLRYRFENINSDFSYYMLTVGVEENSG